RRLGARHEPDHNDTAEQQKCQRRNQFYGPHASTLGSATSFAMVTPSTWTTAGDTAGVLNVERSADVHNENGAPAWFERRSAGNAHRAGGIRQSALILAKRHEFIESALTPPSVISRALPVTEAPAGQG